MIDVSSLKLWVMFDGYSIDTFYT